jgi:hypothetical protein
MVGLGAIRCKSRVALFVLERMLLFLPMLGDFAVSAGPVQWIHIGIEDDLVEMPDDGGQAGKHYLAVMMVVATSTAHCGRNFVTSILKQIMRPVTPMMIVPHTTAQYSIFPA